MLCTEVSDDPPETSVDYEKGLQLGCTFSCEKLLGNIQLWFVLRHTEKWKEEFRKCVRTHWEEYKDKMMRSYVSCRVLEKEDVGKRKWEEDERQRKERRKEIKRNLTQAFQGATARQAANAEQESEQVNEEAKNQEKEQEAEKNQEKEQEAEKEEEKEHEAEKEQEKEHEAEKEQEEEQEAEKEQEKEESEAGHQLSVIIAEVITF